MIDAHVFPVVSLGRIVRTFRRSYIPSSRVSSWDMGFVVSTSWAACDGIVGNSSGFIF